MAPSRGHHEKHKSIDQVPLPPTPSARRTNWFYSRLLALLAVIALVHRFRGHLTWREETGAFGLPSWAVTSLGPYSPWYPAARYKDWPYRCVVTQVNVLQRHGARYPTFGAALRIGAAVNKLKNASEYLDDRFHFLRDFEYDLGADDLVDYGRQEAVDSAKTTYKRYKHLFGPGELGWVRASISGRVVESAQLFMEEMVAHMGNDAELDGPLIINDKPRCNNTLSAHMCPNADPEPVSHATRLWLAEHGAAIAARLNAQAPGANLDPVDAPALISLCGFHSVATNSASPFCSLFDRDDFAAFERLASQLKYHSNGFGHPLGPVQGVGYTNELIARLSEQPLVDSTQSNRSQPFPLGYASYVDFTHDTLLVSVVSAMGLVSKRVEDFKSGEICPFAGRLVFERADCSRGHDLPAGQQAVRALLNDKVVGKWDTVEAFVAEQRYAREMGQGDWEKCDRDKDFVWKDDYETV